MITELYKASKLVGLQMNINKTKVTMNFDIEPTKIKIDDRN